MFLIIFFIFLIIFDITAQRILTKKFQIEKGKNFFYEHVNDKHKLGERFLLIAMIAIPFIFVFMLGYESIEYYFLGVPCIILIYRTYMEWKYERESKMYVRTIFHFVTAFLLFISITVYTAPEEINKTYQAYAFSADRSISEVIELTLEVEFQKHVFADLMHGTVYMDGEDYFLTSFGKERSDLMKDKFKRDSYNYMIYGDHPGELWISKDFNEMAGQTGTYNELYFAAPAGSREEAENLFKKLSESQSD
ncbi:DUF4181 domain-containing protein [Evansella tamaricis]|uniref:DUF4181 domain-containing protein n=1 Tax=Evansella tamaricis TaxID=2069301 RepID=A0ABS6JJK4_9BACI|nr:DUF4181 domain-containing protein [Evansella tamaricis]MBU9713864.1 DUF4181 domain-containing protein [Evansella tamaricis]